MKGYGIKKNNEWFAIVEKKDYDLLKVFCRQRGIDEDTIIKISNLSNIDYMTRHKTSMQILHSLLVTENEKAVYEVFTKEENDTVGYALAGLTLVQTRYDLDEDDEKILNKAIKIMRKKVMKNKVKHTNNILDTVKMIIEMSEEAKQLVLYGHYGMYSNDDF